MIKYFHSSTAALPNVSVKKEKGPITLEMVRVRKTS